MYKNQLRRGYEVEYQPEYQAGNQSEGRDRYRAAQRLIPSLIRGFILA